jgi:hypothetical protein
MVRLPLWLAFNRGARLLAREWDRLYFTVVKFEFFEGLSESEAQDFLESYLRSESQNIGPLLEQCSAEGVRVDYSVTSVPELFLWIVPRLEAVRQKPDEQLPVWLRTGESYTKNLFDFDQASACLILRASYYLGASFVREFNHLKWATGNREAAQSNMPVVMGFRRGLEMAPILIAENLFRRVIAYPAKMDDIRAAVGCWKADAQSS